MKAPTTRFTLTVTVELAADLGVSPKVSPQAIEETLQESLTDWRDGRLHFVVEQLHQAAQDVVRHAHISTVDRALHAKYPVPKGRAADDQRAWDSRLVRIEAATRLAEAKWANVLRAEGKHQALWTCVCSNRTCGHRDESHTRGGTDCPECGDILEWY